MLLQCSPTSNYLYTARVCMIFYSCNMGTSDLPEMYAQSPKAQPEDCGHNTFQANHKCPFYSYYVTLPLRLIALMPIRVRPLGSLYACPKGPIMVMQQVML